MSHSLQIQRQLERPLTDLYTLSKYQFKQKMKEATRDAIRLEIFEEIKNLRFHQNERRRIELNSELLY